MGTCTVSYLGTGVFHNKRYADVEVTFSNSYATSGDTLPLTGLPIRKVTEVWQDGNVAKSDSGLSVKLGGTVDAPKLLAYDAQDTEVSNATNLSTRVVPLRLMGA